MDITPLAELLLFNASRSQLIDKVIKPKLEGGKVVICDRFTDSTSVYQGYGRGLDFKLIETVNNIATQGIKPDLTILLDIPPAKGFRRKFGDIKDNFERELLEFHMKIHQGYLKLAAEEPQRWLVIDASQSKETIAEIIWQKVKQLTHQKNEA